MTKCMSICQPSPAISAHFVLAKLSHPCYYITLNTVCIIDAFVSPLNKTPVKVLFSEQIVPCDEAAPGFMTMKIIISSLFMWDWCWCRHLRVLVLSVLYIRFFAILCFVFTQIEYFLLALTQIMWMLCVSTSQILCIYVYLHLYIDFVVSPWTHH